MKPENAINVPEKYRKPSRKTKSTGTTEKPKKREEEMEEEREEAREEEKYDIDPRQAAKDADLSKVNV